MAVSCAGCGAIAARPPATWSSSGTDSDRRFLCERCTRENLRSIEGRLDEAWW